MKDIPYIFNEIEKVFLNWDNAHHYIIDTYPYYVFYKDKDFYAMPDLKDDKEFEHEERYYILERPIMDEPVKLIGASNVIHNFYEFGY